MNIKNEAGATIFNDEMRHDFIDIPKVSSIGDGKVYEVLSVGTHKNGSILVTIKEEGSVTAYKLPNELKDWVIASIDLARKGMNVFPSQVEFGENTNGYYAELV